MTNAKRIVVWLVVGTALSAVALAVEDLEARAEKLEGRLMAPCCGANPLSDHFSGPAEEMKIEIRRMLAEGRSEQEIIDFYVARHGEKILAAPPARGFNLLAYFGGLLVLAGGSVIVVVWMRRTRPARQDPTGPAAPAPSIDPEDAERVARALRAMD